MTHQIKIQTKITGRLILIHVLLSLFPACINSSAKSEKDSRNGPPGRINILCFNSLISIGGKWRRF